MAFEVKGNPNPHIPPTQVHQSKTQQMHGGSSAPPTGVQGQEDEEKGEESSEGKQPQTNPRAT